MPSSWTVIAYLVADDEREPLLNNFARAELQALKEAAAATDTRLAVYVDFTGTGPNSQSQICFVDGSNGNLSTACNDTPETNVATPGVLRSFFDFAKSKSDNSTRYAVFFWGHGAGPAGLFLDPEPSPAHSLSLPQIWQAFQVFQKPVDVILFRDCWVSTLEAAYEFDDIANFMIASQGLIPIPGVWPYAALFDELRNTNSTFDGAAAHRLLDHLETYYNFEDNRGFPPLDHVVYSALDLSVARGNLAPTLRRLVNELQSLTGSPKVTSRQAMSTAVGGDPALIDVKTFCDLLMPLGGNIAGVAGELKTVLNGVAVVTTRGTAGSSSPPTNMTGVSLFRRPQTLLSSSNFVTEVFYSNYENLALSGATGWIDIAFETVFSHV
jgi:hypothetical protein